jgi:predicted Zn-dependent protease
VGLDRARSAFERGNDAEALIWLWQELERARLREDLSSLADISAVATAIAERGSEATAGEARRLLAQLPASESLPPRSASATIRGALRNAVLLALVFAAVFVASETLMGGGRFDQPPIETADLGRDAPGETRRLEPGVYLVPLGRMERAPLLDAARILSTRYRLRIRVEPAAGVAHGDVDRGRGQLEGDHLMDTLARRYPTLSRTAKARVIGVTELDLYLDRTSHRFSFSTYSNRHRIAAVSTARMDPANYLGLRRLVGLDGGAGKRDERLFKMLTRALGMGYFGLPLQEGWETALGGPIDSLGDLDRLGDHLPTLPGVWR